MQNLKKISGKEQHNQFTIEDFWNWFIDNEQQFSIVIKERADIEKLFFDQLTESLGRLRDEIFFLAGEYDNDLLELILTPDGNIKNVEFVERLVASAPQIDGWKFTAFKPAQNVENVSIKYGEYVFEQDQLFFYSNDSDQYPDLIDLTFVHVKYSDEVKEIIANGTHLFLDMYIGELNCISIIDHVDYCSHAAAEKELIPIRKLKAFLNWRNKEFVERYEGIWRSSGEDQHTLFEGSNQEGKPVIALMNTDVLGWDKKASHPWILKVAMAYDGEDNNGFPTTDVEKVLEDQEDDLYLLLPKIEGYIFIGRQTGNNQRQIYFACKDFREPSKVLHDLVDQQIDPSPISFELYKDKYWRTFEQFKPV